MERRLVVIPILLLSLTSLTYSLFQVKKATPNPTLLVERQIFTPASSLINATGHGLAVVNLKSSSFENPFINYSSVVSTADEQEVLKTRFIRSTDRKNREYIQFLSIVNNTEKVVRVNHTIELAQEYLVDYRTTLVMYVWTNLNGARLSLLGTDSSGNETDIMFFLSEAFGDYYLYIRPVQDSLETIQRINLTHICQPEGYFKAQTLFYILNIFSEAPSIDSEDLVEGDWWVKIQNIEFPHTFSWEQLKAQNMTIIIRWSVDPEFTSTYNSVKYLWKVPDPVASTDFASIGINFDRVVEAPITQAQIIVEENGVPDTIDIVGNITEAFSSDSQYPRVDISIPNNGRNCQVVMTYLYWSPLWVAVALSSLTAISAVVLSSLFYRRMNESDLSNLTDNQD